MLFTLKLENIEEMAGVPPNSIILDLVKSLQSNSFQTMETSAQNIISEGYPVPSIISMLFDCVVKDMALSDLSKAEICIKIAESDKHLVDGANELLQLMSVCCLAMQCYARDACSSETAAGVCY
jgi:replication factor C subunit 2/4